MHQQQRSSSDVLESGTRVESAAVGRKDTQPRGNAHAAEAFSGRDPLDRVDAAGNALTQPFPVDPSAGGFGGPAANTPTTGPVAGKARVRATEARPLVTLRPSSEDQLVELLPADAPAQDALPVTKRFGSIDAPGTYEDLAPDALFIGGRPHVEDVRQGSLGTCYLLADLLSVVNADPAHIEQMISLRGGVAMVLFHRYEEAAKQWVPAPVVVDTKLARDAQNMGSLVGAGFRVSEEPVSAAWHAEVNENPDGNELAIWRRSVHEAALWAPLIEKAYARFAEMWGQFGGHPSHRDTEKRGGSGYDAVEGGLAAPALRVLYGERLADRQAATVVEPGNDLLHDNMALVRQMVAMGTAGKPTRLVTASASTDEIPSRLAKLLRAADTEGLPPEAVSACFSTRIAAELTAAGIADARVALLAHAGALVALLPADGAGPLAHARELCTVLLNDAREGGGSPESLYANHAYAVLGIELRDAAGQDLPMAPEEVGRRIAEVDPTRTTVRLRNPHGHDEPTIGSTVDGTDDGAFALSLERFLTLYTHIDSGIVR